jgi:UDP-sulfoquinovose synthase
VGRRAGDLFAVWKRWPDPWFIDLRDIVRCVELALANPAPPGDLRVFNQFTEQWSVGTLAERVRRVAAARGLRAEVVHIENPRVEAESHYYEATHSSLLELGLAPHLLSDETIEQLIDIALAHRERIRFETTAPAIDWRTGGPPTVPATGGMVRSTV